MVKVSGPGGEAKVVKVSELSETLPPPYGGDSPVALGVPSARGRAAGRWGVAGPPCLLGCVVMHENREKNRDRYTVPVWGGRLGKVRIIPK